MTYVKWDQVIAGVLMRARMDCWQAGPVEGQRTPEEKALLDGKFDGKSDPFQLGKVCCPHGVRAPSHA